MTIDNEDEEYFRRKDAVQLILAAFQTAAAHRLNTPDRVTMTQGLLSLRVLGVESEDIEAAASEMGLTL